MARLKPSAVDVPRPNSSMITKEFFVAVFSKQLASSISDIKVEIQLKNYSNYNKSLYL